MNHEELIASIRTRLAMGYLPLAGQTVTAGPGTSRTCIVCLTPITPQEIELEVSDDAGGLLVSHFACYLLWRAETLRHGTSGEMS
jgi:hypothetical protein